MPQPERRRWFGIAAGVLVLHWLLIIGWGWVLNDSAYGYLYCRLVMPSDFQLTDTPWLFTFAGTLIVFALGFLDHTAFRLSRRLSFYPSVGFVFTQVFLLWYGITSTRY